jgi:drug/metabolite transporter (DMT)-like permease
MGERMPFAVMLLVLLGAALHATWNALVKAGSDRYLDTALVVTGAALLTLLWLPFLPLPSRASWPYLAASVLIHQGYFALIALSYRTGDMSLVYPLTRGTAPALTALGSALVLREHPSWGGWAGMLLVSGGVLLLACDTRRSEGVHAPAVLLALANAGVVALYTLVDGTGVRLSGQAFSYTSWGFLLSALLFTPVAFLVRGREAARYLCQQWRRSLIGGGCSVAAYSLALWAMTRASIPSVAALRETSILFGVLIAAFTLKERVTRFRFAAALLVLAGVVIIKVL